MNTEQKMRAYLAKNTSKTGNTPDDLPQSKVFSSTHSFHVQDMWPTLAAANIYKYLNTHLSKLQARHPVVVLDYLLSLAGF